jgi:hypothetical protein
VEHGQLVTKGENLSSQRGASPKTGGEKSEKSNKDRAHRGRNHHLTSDGNLCVFKSDGVFGMHTLIKGIMKQSGISRVAIAMLNIRLAGTCLCVYVAFIH